MEKFKFARKCDITGEGMNEGWVINGGFSYIKYESDALAYARLQNHDSIQSLYEACEENGDSDGFYWTSWEDDDSDHYYESMHADGRDAVYAEQ